MADKFRTELYDVIREWWDARPCLHGIDRLPRQDLVAIAVLSALSASSTALVWSSPLVADAAVQLEMARSFGATGEFLVEGAYSDFYPPVYPLFLFGFGALLGYSVETVHVVQAILLATIVLSTYLVSSAFGRKVGLLASLWVALNPVLLGEAGEGRATLLAALLLLWLFHFVRKGVENERNLGWAGLLAGALYLTKDTAGYVAALGILVGLVWRVRSMGFKPVVTSRHYLLGGAIFVTMVSAWSIRNLVRLGSPFSSPAILGYSERFLFSTSPLEGALLVGGIAVLFLFHWMAWIWPSMAHPHLWTRTREIWLRLRRDETKMAILVFLGTTWFLSSLVSAIFIRNEGNRFFPSSVPLYYRLLGIADPILMAGAALLIFAPDQGFGRWLRTDVLKAVQATAIALLLLSSWPSTVANASHQTTVYTNLGAFLQAHDEPYYSEASTILAANLPQTEWIHVELDFSGPYLDHRKAGVPQGANLVTVGHVDGADFVSGPYSVLLDLNWSEVQDVRNPFFSG